MASISDDYESDYRKAKKMRFPCAATLHQNPERGVSEAMVFASLLHEAKRLRDEFAGLPHSLGYEYTHLPSINAAIDAAEAALSAPEPAAQGEAVAWRYWIEDDATLNPFWTGWSADVGFRQLIEKRGYAKVEYAYTAPPAQPAGGKGVEG